MELRMKTPEKFLFPAFETLQWYAAKYYAQMLKDFNTNQASNYKNKNHNSFNIIDATFMNELKYLRDTLKRWINSKEVSSRHNILIFLNFYFLFASYFSYTFIYSFYIIFLL